MKLLLKEFQSVMSLKIDGTWHTLSAMLMHIYQCILELLPWQLGNNQLCV